MILRKDGLSASRAGGGVGARGAAGSELPFPIGATVAGRSLVGVVGAGRRAVVYEAERGGRTTALKVLHPGETLDTAVLGRLVRAAPGSLRHPSLAPVEELGEAEGLEYCVRPLYRGDSLARLLGDIGHGRAGRPHLSPLAPAPDGTRRPGFFRAAVALFGGVARALAVVHGGNGDPGDGGAGDDDGGDDGGDNRGGAGPLVHGRIHPGNLILSPSGVLVLCDLEGDPAAAVTAGGRGETPAEDGYVEYLAPEQIRALAEGEPIPFDAATDVYSLASVLHRLVYGRLPDATEAALGRDADESRRGEEELDPAVTREERRVAAELEAVLRRATAPDPADRYLSASAFAADLGRLIELEPTEAGSTRGLVLERRIDLPGDIRAPALETPEENGEPAPLAATPRITFDGPDEVALESKVAASEPEATAAAPEPRHGPAADDHAAAARALLLEPSAHQESPGGFPPAHQELREPVPPVRRELPAPAPGTEPPAAAEVAAPSRRRAIAAAAGLALVLLGAAAWIALALHGRLEDERRRAGALGHGVEKLEAAITALSREEPLEAAEALGEARSVLEGRAGLGAIEERLRSRSADGPVAALEDRRAAVRLEAIDAIRREIEAGLRPADDLDAVACCVFDDDARVRARAIEACCAAGLVEPVLGAYPLARGGRLRVDATTFVALYRGLGAAAAGGDRRALDAVRAVDLDVIDRIGRGGDAAGAGAEGTGTEAAGATAVVVVAGTGVERVELLREWIRVRAAVDGEAFLTELPRLEPRPGTFPELVGALERIGGPRAIRALRGLAERRLLRAGADAIEALGRLGAVGDLIEMASEPFPLAFRTRAMEAAVARAGDADRERIERVMRTHADAAVRAVAFDGLAESGHLARRPGSLIGALGDPALRLRALRHLEREPHAEAVPALLRMLESTAADNRIAVARALAVTGHADALEPLSRQLFETDARIRRAVVETLRDLGDDRALPLAAGILGRRYPGIDRFARDMLEVPPERRREQPQRLVLALQEIFELIGPTGESIGIPRFRRALLLAPLGADLSELDRRIPERIRKAVERRREEVPGDGGATSPDDPASAARE